MTHSCCRFTSLTLHCVQFTHSCGFSRKTLSTCVYRHPLGNEKREKVHLVSTNLSPPLYKWSRKFLEKVTLSRTLKEIWLNNLLSSELCQVLFRKGKLWYLQFQRHRARLAALCKFDTGRFGVSACQSNQP